LSINEWNNDNLSAPLEAFPSGDCLQVWYLFEEAQPPGNCVIRHGWVSVNEQKLFWRNTDVFTVYRYGEEVTVCTIEAGYCDVNLGAQAAPVPEAPENDYWVRVQLPNNPGETGWISGTLLGSAYDMSSLHIADPTRPHFAPMQSMSILLNQNSTTAQSSALDGVLIQTPSGEKSIILEINGASFEIAANSKFFWRGATNELAELETETENSYDLINRRRPEGWSATVLRGAVRVNINYLDEKNQEDQTYTVTLVAGTEIEYNSTSAEAEDITTETATHTPEDSALSPSIPVIVTTSNDSAEINAAMASTPGEEDSADALSDAEMDEFWNNQALFNAVNMDYAVIMGDYFIDDPMGNNYHESGDDEQLIDFMFDETDIDIYGLATLVEGNEDLYYLFIEDEEYVEYFGDEYGYNPFEDPNYDPFCDTNPNDPYCQETFVDCSLYPEDPICVNDGDDLDCPCDVDFECSPGCNCDPECGEYDNYGYCGCDIDNECSPGCECDFECSSDPYYGGEPVG